MCLVKAMQETTGWGAMRRDGPCICSKYKRCARAEGDSVYKHKTIKPKEVKYGLKYAIRSKLGQEPVSVDTAKMVKVRKQLEIYLHKNGFFSGQVRDTILYKEKNE